MADTIHNSNQESENAVALAAGVMIATVEDRIANLDGVPLALVPKSMDLRILHEVLKTQEERDDRPWRLKGTAVLQEQKSFITHVNRFKDQDSVIFADVPTTTLLAVLNYHGARNAEGKPSRDAEVLQRWADHRAKYTCPLSQAWKTWTSRNGVEMDQETFHDFIEQNAHDLTSPDKDENDQFAKPAKLIEVARAISIHTKGEITRQVNPTTGEYTMVVKDEHAPSSTKIPRGFLLGIPVFQAGGHYRLEAQVRFQIKNGRPVFMYVLMQPERMVQDAFDAVRESVATDTQLPVLAGSPEA